MTCSHQDSATFYFLKGVTGLCFNGLLLLLMFSMAMKPVMLAPMRSKSFSEEAQPLLGNIGDTETPQNMHNLSELPKSSEANTLSTSLPANEKQLIGHTGAQPSSYAPPETFISQKAVSTVSQHRQTSQTLPVANKEADLPIVPELQAAHPVEIYFFRSSNSPTELPPIDETPNFPKLPPSLMEDSRIKQIVDPMTNQQREMFLEHLLSELGNIHKNWKTQANLEGGLNHLLEDSRVQQIIGSMTNQQRKMFLEYILSELENIHKNWETQANLSGGLSHLMKD
ncbi:hypothetical protein O181_096556, partial [Austropuccinia psidii MF-1]|nr:hypothetical protein [Austropuccinia psidii MF-1]